RSAPLPRMSSMIPPLVVSPAKIVSPRACQPNADQPALKARAALVPSDLKRPVGTVVGARPPAGPISPRPPAVTGPAAAVAAERSAAAAASADVVRRRNPWVSAETPEIAPLNLSALITEAKPS